MKVNRTSVGVAAISLVLTGLGLVVSAPTASAADGCPAPAAAPAPYTASTTYLFGRTIELRFSYGPHCGWGRISRAASSDEIWVNRNSVDLSRSGGKAYVAYGSTSAYTPQAFYDLSPRWMTACGKASNRPEIACTSRY
jgi:Protein of unknown function (DUF2690)